MSMKKIDAVKYRANDYRIDKRGKRTPSRFSFWVRASGVWTTAAESGDERAEKYRGVFSADVAAMALPGILTECGLEVPAGVKTAAMEATSRLAKKARERVEREVATVQKGRAAFLGKKADSAKRAWDRLKERVDGRAKTDADASATDAATDTAENAADIVA